MSDLFLVFLCNNTIQIFLGQYIPYILEHQIITQLPSDTHLKSVKLSINPVQYEKQYSPSRVAITTASSRLQTSQNFFLCTAQHTFLAFPLVAMHHQPISLHVHWSSNSAIHYIFTVTTYYSTFCIY